MEKIVGINPVYEALREKKDFVKLEIYKGVRKEKISGILSLAKSKGVKVEYKEKREENSQGVVLFVNDYEYYMEFGEFMESLIKEEKSTVLVLDGVQDPRNFGAIIRSAETFGVKGIIIPERNSVKINETVIKTSTGAIERVRIIPVTNLTNAIKELKKIDFWVYGAEASGKVVYHKEKYPDKTCLILGSEGKGIRKKLKENCDILLNIPMFGKINSLNVSVAGGILLAEISKYRS